MNYIGTENVLTGVSAASSPSSGTYAAAECTYGQADPAGRPSSMKNLLQHFLPVYAGEAVSTGSCIQRAFLP